MPDSGASEATIALSASAARKIAEILAADPHAAGVRLAVEGGGCSGFQYDIRIVAGPEADDLVIERDGGRLFVDSVSLEFLGGAVFDWTDDLIGSAFKVKNPNAKSSCGCGVSFSV
jgi:iron-sulfur cluster assembly accessory protein